MSTSKQPKSRCWVCSYLLWMHPFTMYQRWFYSEAQANSYLDRQHGVMMREIRHA